MKKLFLLPIVAIAFLFTGCLENDLPYIPAPPAVMVEIIDVPIRQVEGSAATITARVITETPEVVTSVAIEWRVGDGSPTTATMTLANNIWTGDIPTQEDGTRVSFRAVATVTGDEPVYSESQTTIWTDQLAGQLLIFSAFGTGPDGGAASSRSFVELYNTTNAVIDLDGITLHWANSIRGPGITADEAWQMTPLTGTIPAGGSFLILGPVRGAGTAGLVLAEGSGDINDDNLVLNNRGFKVALIRNSDQLTVQNPFTMDGTGRGIARGYIDMVGAVNNRAATNPDNLFGYEYYPARNSGSSATRRTSLVDTDNNDADFDEVRFAEDADARQNKFPRNSSAGSWTPTF